MSSKTRGRPERFGIQTRNLAIGTTFASAGLFHDKPMKNVTFLRVLAGTAAAAWAFLGTACHTAVQRDLFMEEANAAPIEKPIAMKGETTLFDGKLAAMATVERGFDRPKGHRPSSRGSTGKLKANGEPEENEDYSFAHVYFGGGGTSEEDEKEAMKDYVRQIQALRAAGSPMPPVTLRVRFTNNGTEAVEIQVTEVNSELGNFAVRPAKLTIAQGETGTLEPMISQLGVTSDEIPVKLGVFTAGKRENQVVAVKNVITTSARKEFEAKKK